MRTSRTKQRILEAAHAAFVANGFDGANIEAIAAAAGVNKTLVYRHFSNKDELFSVVLEAAYTKVRSGEKDLALETYAPREAIVRLICYTWDYYEANPDFLSLVGTENLCGGRHLAASTRFPAQSSQLVGMVRDIVERGMADGSFRPDVNALQLWISIAAMCWFYVANRHTISVTFGAQMLSPSIRRERLKHILDLVVRDLTGEPAPEVPEPVRPARKRPVFA